MATKRAPGRRIYGLRIFRIAPTSFLEGSKDPTRFLPTWELLYDCWLKSLPLFDPPIEPVSIPYEGTELHGVFIRGASTSGKRPLLILVNGSDGSLLNMWTWGGAGALVRGYNCLTFDGPGQGYALWKQGDFEAAGEYFRAVLERNPEDEQASLLLARCASRTGSRPGEARTEGLERLKTNYEESAYWQLKAVLQPHQHE